MPPWAMLTRKRPRDLGNDDIEWSSQSESRSSSESAAESSTDRSDQESDEPSNRPCTSTRRQKRAKAKELYLQRVQQSLVGVFNRAQTEKQRETMSNYSASTWLKSERPKHSIYPHKLDYCDVCAKKKEELQRNQTTLNRIHQTGSADREEQRKIESEISALTVELERHCEDAKKSHDYYIETKNTCRCNNEWKEIESLQVKQVRTEQEEDILKRLKHDFTAVLSVDYQM